MIRVCVSGGLGRMGGKVVEAIQDEDDLKLIGIVEKKEKEGDRIVFSDITRIIDDVDVVVEFSTPEATIEHLQVAVEHGKMMVIGTTGFSAEQMKEIEKASNRIPIFLSPNMSWGANVMIQISELLVDMLAGYDVEVVEFHHKFKKDAPSGTAKKLIDRIKKEDTRVVYGREGFSPRQDGEIGVHSIRGGSVVGEHKLIISGMGERLEFSHIVWDRMAFAQGTIKAIRFIYNKPEGIYGMDDIFKEVET